MGAMLNGISHGGFFRCEGRKKGVGIQFNKTSHGGLYESKQQEKETIFGLQTNSFLILSYCE